MKSSNLACTGLLLALCVTSAGARPIPTQQPTPGQARDAGAPKTESVPPLAFGVSGLTADNLPKVKESLAALESQVFVCPGCKAEGALAGSCSACKVALEPRTVKLLKTAEPSVENASIRITPDTGRTVRYSDLERTLRQHLVQIDSSKFPVAGTAQLVVRGATDADVSPLEEALLQAKLFDEVEGVYEPATGEIRLAVRAGKTPPPLSKVEAVLEGTGIAPRFADVLWAPRPLKS